MRQSEKHPPYGPFWGRIFFCSWPHFAKNAENKNPGEKTGNPIDISRALRTINSVFEETIHEEAPPHDKRYDHRLPYEAGAKLRNPLMFGNLFQQFYSMVDTIIVGRFLGTGPLAAVGSTGSINFLILGFCTGICAGFTIPVSQSYGAKDFQDLKRFVGNILWLASGFTLVITVLTVALCGPFCSGWTPPRTSSTTPTATSW